MHAQHCRHEEDQCIQVCNTLQPIPSYSPDIEAVSNDNSSVDSSPNVEMLESEEGIWPVHPNVVDECAHDCDSVGQNAVKPDPDPSPPVIASEGDRYNHCYNTIAPYQCCLQCQCSKQK